MQLPMRPAPKVFGQLFSSTTEENLDNGVERSGVKGPLICGSRVERLMVIISSYLASGSAARRFWAVGAEAIAAAALAIGPR